MLKKFVLLLLLSPVALSVIAQADSSGALLPLTKVPGTRSALPSQVYNIKPGIDLPIAIAGSAWSLYGFSEIYGRDASTEAEILALDRNNVNKFDRPVTRQYSEKANSAADMFFYTSMPLPLILMLDREIRKDALHVGILYLESMAITGTLYTTSAMLADRYRPYAYNKEEAPLEKRMRGGAKNSFFAGHVALVGTSTFFMAKVFADYHPEMRNKWILYTIAGGATATTGYLRMRGGQHFRSDVIIGAAVGTLSGILVPSLHKNRTADPRLVINPLIGQSNGFSAVLNINR